MNNRGFKFPYPDADKRPPVLQQGGECDRWPYTEASASAELAKVKIGTVGPCPVCFFDDGSRVWHFYTFEISRRTFAVKLEPPKGELNGMD